MKPAQYKYMINIIISWHHFKKIYNKNMCIKLNKACSCQNIKNLVKKNAYRHCPFLTLNSFSVLMSWELNCPTAAGTEFQILKEGCWGIESLLLADMSWYWGM